MSAIKYVGMTWDILRFLFYKIHKVPLKRKMLLSIEMESEVNKKRTCMIIA